MSFFASCAGQQIVAGTLLIPAVGAWTADLHLATDQAVSGAVSVVIGNLTLAGTVYRADVYGGQVRARVVGGAGGWRTSIPPQGYGSSSGVGLATILGDAAQACGETIGSFNNLSVGNGYARVRFPSSVAGDVLWQLLAQGLIPSWHVDPTGVTQIAAWPTTTVQSPFTPTDQRPDEGVVVVATEDYAAWMPGCQFAHPLLDGTYTSAGVHYVWGKEGEFRFEVLTGEGDRMLGPLQALIDARTAPTRFFGRYEYTISNPTPTTVDASPLDSTLGLPDLQSVPIVADSIAGFTPPDGGICHVMFLNGLPTRPACVWCEADTNTGPAAVTLAPQNSAAPPVARVDDTVVVMFPPLMQIAGTVSGAPFIGVLAITTPASGIIQTGSGTVNCG